MLSFLYNAIITNTFYIYNKKNKTYDISLSEYIPADLA